MAQPGSASLVAAMDESRLVLRQVEKRRRKSKAAAKRRREFVIWSLEKTMDYIQQEGPIDESMWDKITSTACEYLSLYLALRNGKGPEASQLSGAEEEAPVEELVTATGTYSASLDRYIPEYVVWIGWPKGSWNCHTGYENADKVYASLTKNDRLIFRVRAPASRSRRGAVVMGWKTLIALEKVAMNRYFYDKHAPEVRNELHTILCRHRDRLNQESEQLQRAPNSAQHEDRPAPALSCLSYPGSPTSSNSTYQSSRSASPDLPAERAGARSEWWGSSEESWRLIPTVPQGSASTSSKVVSGKDYRRRL